MPKASPAPIGQSFGYWTVLSEAPIQGNHRYLNCKCKCGTVRAVNRRNILRGSSISCGCHPVEKTGRVRVHHGKSKTSLHRIWRKILDRCNNPNNPHYHRYGGRGIRVHPLWEKDFLAFEDYIGPRPSPEHSIDRYPDNNGNYEPGNVRWATPHQQQSNR